jgi:hypothetical protein
MNLRQYLRQPILYTKRPQKTQAAVSLLFDDAAASSMEA